MFDFESSFEKVLLHHSKQNAEELWIPCGVQFWADRERDLILREWRSTCSVT